jgi:hypothetical protein
MADVPRQTYANHAYRPIWWSLTWLLAFGTALWLLWAALRVPSAQAAALAALGLAVLSGVTLIRVFALRLQNRIIRLEMQVRLGRLGLTQAAERLTLRQTIALRFASDAELPALAARAMAEALDAEAIKRAVADWQGDHLRT